MSACQNNERVCENAKQFPIAETIEKGVGPDFTGKINNYWGEDTTKLDMVHSIADGKLVESKFYHYNGNVSIQYNFRCRSLHGTVKYFHENGQLSQEIPYKFGIRQGIAKRFDSLGNKIAQAVFENDSLISKTEF